MFLKDMFPILKYIFHCCCLLTLLLYLCRTDCRILRLPCQTVAEFSIEKKQYMLEGYVIEEFSNVGLHECYEFCLHNKQCKSVNIEMGDYGLCQLNNASSYDSIDNVQLVRNPNWIFRSTNYSDTKVIALNHRIELIQFYIQIFCSYVRTLLQHYYSC